MLIMFSIFKYFCYVMYVIDVMLFNFVSFVGKNDYEKKKEKRIIKFEIFEILC